MVNSTPIGGPGHTTQIDGLVVAKKTRFSNWQARSVQPQWVFGGVNSTARQFKNSAVMKLIQLTGNFLIKEHVSLLAMSRICFKLLCMTFWGIVFFLIIYLMRRAFCDAHHFKILGVFVVFTSSFKLLNMKYTYQAMDCCDISSSLSVYFCQKPENIWLAP